MSVKLQIIFVLLFGQVIHLQSKEWRGESSIATYSVQGGYHSSNFHPSKMFDKKSNTEWHSNTQRGSRGVTINFKKNIRLDELKIQTRSGCCRDRYKHLEVTLDGRKYGDNYHAVGKWFYPKQGSWISFKDSMNNEGKTLKLRWVKEGDNQFAQISELIVVYGEAELKKTCNEKDSFTLAKAPSSKHFSIETVIGGKINKDWGIKNKLDYSQGRYMFKVTHKNDKLEKCKLIKTVKQLERAGQSKEWSQNQGWNFILKDVKQTGCGKYSGTFVSTNNYFQESDSTRKYSDLQDTVGFQDNKNYIFSTCLATTKSVNFKKQVAYFAANFKLQSELKKAPKVLGSKLTPQICKYKNISQNYNIKQEFSKTGSGYQELHTSTISKDHPNQKNNQIYQYMNFEVRGNDLILTALITNKRSSAYFYAQDNKCLIDENNGVLCPICNIDSKIEIVAFSDDKSVENYYQNLKNQAGDYKKRLENKRAQIKLEVQQKYGFCLIDNAYLKQDVYHHLEDNCCSRKSDGTKCIKDLKLKV